jgi:TetR/AcrR family transcriptional regulator, transcriptional repressor for nem operon
MKSKEKILQSAFILFREKGFLETGIAEILDKAGCYKKTLYDHFKSKDEIGFEYLRFISKQQQEMMFKISEKSNSIDEFIDKWIRFSLREQRNFDRLDCPIALFSGEVSHLVQFNLHSKAAIQMVLDTIEVFINKNRSDLNKIKQKELSQELYMIYLGGLRLFSLTKDKKVIEQMKGKMKLGLIKHNLGD